MTTKMLVRTSIWIVATAAMLFLSAGTVNWPGAWVFLAETAIAGFAMGFWLARCDPALLAERLASPIQRGQQLWDKILMSIFVLAVIAWFVLMAFDAARYRWSDVPAWAQAIGAAAVFITMYLGYLTFRANTFAAPVVKIQTERAQQVVTTGPYRYVRHPLYAGALFYFVGTPLLLGSWYGLAVAPVLTLLLAIRTVMEERTLADGLAGYTEYAARVRYRFIPWIW